MKMSDLTYNGYIEMIIGPMFSSKTSTLINRMERYLLAKRKVVAIKWKGDIRYTNDPVIQTHSRLTCPCIPCTDETLMDIYTNTLCKYDIICIDEACFFKSIVPFCEMCANKGHHVIVSTLISTFQREGFNHILDLIPKCEKIHMLSAVCMRCFKDGATFTMRTTTDDATEIVGGAETYQSVCRECYFKYVNGPMGEQEQKDQGQ